MLADDLLQRAAIALTKPLQDIPIDPAHPTILTTTGDSRGSVMFARAAALTPMRSREGDLRVPDPQRGEKTMTRPTILAATAFTVFIGVAASASADTLTGRISDAMCGPSHDTATEHGKKMTDKQCTLACVQRGSSYVFVTHDNKVLKIANQDFGSLKDFAGDAVTLTGDVKGDTVRVTRIEKAK